MKRLLTNSLITTALAASAVLTTSGLASVALPPLPLTTDVRGLPQSP